jgi:hypothetical protein
VPGCGAFDERRDLSEVLCQSGLVQNKVRSGGSVRQVAQQRCTIIADEECDDIKTSSDEVGDLVKAWKRASKKARKAAKKK